jgi:hypothetical protein|tara:strand:- start:56 stop:1207 length:1152 start_codon:yes stop_codon:yes gene_type:complete
MATDQEIRDAGILYLPLQQYLANPFVLPEDEDDGGGSGGVSSLPVQMGRDDERLTYDQVTPRFDDKGRALAKEYGPGGRYEINPLALGFEFGPQGQVMRAGPRDYMQTQLGPSTTPGGRLFDSNLNEGIFFDGKQGLGGLTLGQIADMYDSRMEMLPGKGMLTDIRNAFKRFGGAQSNFAAARAPGTFEKMLEKIPTLTGILSAIGGNTDRSDTSRFAVDNVGYGQGTQRDQFGVFTGGKTTFGKTKNYSERMRNEISDIAKNFGYSEEDLLNLDPATLEALGQRNNFRKTQVIDYVNKLQGKELERIAKKQREEAVERERLEDLGRDKDRGGFDPSGPTQRSIREDRPDRSGKGQSGGFTNPGKESYGPFMAKGGLAGILGY